MMGSPEWWSLPMLIILGRMVGSCQCFLAAKINIYRRVDAWPIYPLSGCFLKDAQFLSTNLLDKGVGPDPEDGQIVDET